MKPPKLSVIYAILSVLAPVSLLIAAEPSPPPDVLSPPHQPITDSPSSDRYGPFNLLDHRSIYGAYWFPEPLRADEADVDNEIRADWTHDENHGHQVDELKFEIEKSLGLFTFEIAPTWSSDRTATFNSATHKTERTHEEGFGNVELGARVPFYQYVSPTRFFDTTFVFGTELAIPTQTEVSKDWELVPKLFNLTRLGDHFAIKSGLGNSLLIGPVDHGLSTLEYNITFAYELPQDQLPLPGVVTTWPIFELNGEYTFNHEDAGHNQLFATVGFRFNFDTLKGLPLQPRLGIGYTFPLDKGARDEFRWGLVTSLIFEY